MIKNKIINFSLFIFICFVSLSSQATVQPIKARHPFYVGISGGYGATTWGSLVPKEMSEAMSTSVPIQVNEGGKVWGVFAGYEIIPEFAFEASYMRYPTARLFFDETSLLTDKYSNTITFTTTTTRIALVGKFLLTIPYTHVRAYSSFGAAEVHRSDVIVKRWRLSPTFGAGLNYDITDHIMTELGTEYVAGYGKAEMIPAEHFIPFLYSVFLRIAYRF